MRITLNNPNNPNLSGTGYCWIVVAVVVVVVVAVGIVQSWLVVENFVVLVTWEHYL